MSIPSGRFSFPWKLNKKGVNFLTVFDYNTDGKSSPSFTNLYKAYEDIRNLNFKLIANDAPKVDTTIRGFSSTVLDNKDIKLDANIGYDNWLEHYLTDVQRKFVCSDILGPERLEGAAGTGKTLMAVEKARRHAEKGDRVLFLCYNTKLKEHLISTYPNQFIDYYTIDGFACKMCNTPEPNYELLQNILVDYIDQEFPYKHIIIDECQDFGQDKLDEVKILETLYELIYEKDDDRCTFYVFYDKNQLVQGRKLPDFINSADCKLTLYRNCRNTENIALSSIRLLGSDKKPKLFERAITGSSPVIFFEPEQNNQIAAINQILDKYIDKYGDNIVILTCSTTGNSILSEYIDKSYYRHNGIKVPITTCRKFKGLEADAIILIDIDKKYLVDDLGKKLTYVGSSRARYDLALVTDLNEEEICTILDENKKRHTKKPAKELANMFNAKYLQIEEEQENISLELWCDSCFFRKTHPFWT